MTLNPEIALDLVGHQGKRLDFDLALASDADLTGYTSSGKVVDKSGTEILAFTPTIDLTAKLWQFTIDLPSDAALGSGKWVAYLVVSGKQVVAAGGAFNVRKEL